jgi:HlyD family type I secretion membrane fusion protein
VIDNRTLRIPADPRPTILIGFAVALLSIGGFVGWATFAPLAEAVVASGMIKVDSSRKQIQHLEGGIVKEILVRDGDRVRQGEILIRLDETRAAASLAIVRDGYDAAIAQEARLIAEREGSEYIKFPDTLLARTDDPKVAEIIKAQRAVLDARRQAVSGQTQILEKQVAHLREDISGLKAQISAKGRQLAFVHDELQSVRKLLKKGLSGKQRVLELEREVARLQGERAEHQSEIAAAEAQISAKELEIHQVSNSFRENVVNELKQVQGEIFDFRERLNAAEHVFSQTEVRSPVDGVVVGSGVHTIGGVVSPGETLLQLVPLNDELIVEARVDPQDIDKVRLGLPAGVKFTAFNQRTTPELAGTLSYVSADALHDQQANTSYFVARIEVAEDEVERLGERQLQPGMMADVFIRTGERTMADYLLQPIRDSFRRAWLEE